MLCMLEVRYYETEEGRSPFDDWFSMAAELRTTYRRRKRGAS
jgi:hypothetical protein